MSGAARLALIVIMLAPGAAAAQLCAMDPRGWCPAAADDPCGRHRNVESCRADPRCYGLPYRGESVVACHYDARGFGLNCPTVGCTSVR
jgi:hypothetical protein